MYRLRRTNVLWLGSGVGEHLIGSMTAETETENGNGKVVSGKY